MNKLISFETKFMKDYNYIIFLTPYFKLKIGRPFIPCANRFINWYKQTKLYKCLHYYRLRKKQTDEDIFYVAVRSIGYDEEEAIRKNYTLELEFKELEPQIPILIKKLIEKRIDRYYSKKIVHY